MSDQNIDVLKEGVMYCQQQQQALLRVGASIIEKKQIRIAEKFRYTFLTDLVERVILSSKCVCEEFSIASHAPETSSIYSSNKTTEW